MSGVLRPLSPFLRQVTRMWCLRDSKEPSMIVPSAHAITSGQLAGQAGQKYLQSLCSLVNLDRGKVDHKDLQGRYRDTPRVALYAGCLRQCSLQSSRHRICSRPCVSSHIREGKVYCPSLTRRGRLLRLSCSIWQSGTSDVVVQGPVCGMYCVVHLYAQASTDTREASHSVSMQPPSSHVELSSRGRIGLQITAPCHNYQAARLPRS